MTTSAKRLIIFDLDGTLIDSADDLATATNRMRQRLNLPPIAPAIITSWVGNGSYKLTERALADTNFNNQQIHHAHELFLAEYALCLTEQTTCYQGVQEGLKTLANLGITLALCTNKPARYLPTILAKFGWQHTFARVLGGDDLPTKKPDPAPLLHLCQTLQIPVAQSIMVGDSKNDIIAGRAAGMMTLAFDYGYNHGEPIQLSKPDAIFGNFAELVAYVEDLLTKTV